MFENAAAFFTNGWMIVVYCLLMFWFGYTAGLNMAQRSRLPHFFKTRRGICRECGCTDDRACVDPEGRPCFWVEDTLCSSCHLKMAYKDYEKHPNLQKTQTPS